MKICILPICYNTVNAIEDVLYRVLCIHSNRYQIVAITFPGIYVYWFYRLTSPLPAPDLRL
jgi:hypothetical protein